MHNVVRRIRSLINYIMVELVEYLLMVIMFKIKLDLQLLKLEMELYIYYFYKFNYTNFLQ